jgi:hypothetical protein
MALRYQVKPPPPLFRARDVVRLLMLGGVIVFMIFAIHKASNPAMWQWVRIFEKHPASMDEPEEPVKGAQPSQAQQLEMQLNAGRAVGFLAAFTMPSPVPFNIDAAVAGTVHLEHVPLPEHVVQRPRQDRRAPYPNPQTLLGALDRQRILLDNPIVTSEDPDDRRNEQFRLDADARYHLLQVAHDARAEDLAADARTDFRYSALREKPADYRGELLHIEGELLWIQPFELKSAERKIPGLEHAYQGAITVGAPDKGYWILFTELPPNFPPESDWPKLYRYGVKFDGYFLKVLLIDNPKEKGKFLYVPLLVGKTVSMPPTPSGAWDFPLWPTVSVLGGVLLVVLVVGYFYRKHERAYALRLAATRKAAQDRSRELEQEAGESPFRGFEPPPDAPEPPNRNGAH